jgi:hypothetical protein
MGSECQIRSTSAAFDLKSSLKLLQRVREFQSAALGAFHDLFPGSLA